MTNEQEQKVIDAQLGMSRAVSAEDAQRRARDEREAKQGPGIASNGMTNEPVLRAPRAAPAFPA